MGSSAFQQSYRAILWNVFSVGFGFVNGVLSARLLLPEGRGTLSVALTLGSISALLSGMGTNVAFRTLLPRAEAGLRNYIKVTSWLFPVIIVLGAAVALWSLRAAPRDSLFVLDLIVVALVCSCSFMATQAFDVLNAAGRNSISARINMTGNGIVALLLCLLTIYGGSLRSVFVCYLMAYILRQALLTRAIYLLRPVLSADVSGSEKALLGLGVRFMGLNVGLAFTFRIDLIVVELFRGAASAGLYAVAAVPAAVLQIFSSTIGQVVFRHVADGSFGRKAVLKYAGIAVAITFTGALVVFAASDWVVPLAFGVEYRGAVPLLKVLVVAELCLSPYLVLCRAAAGLKMSRVASGSGFLGVLMMSGCLLVLVPAYGAWGAAFACIATYASMSLYVSIPVLRALPA